MASTLLAIEVETSVENEAIAVYGNIGRCAKFKTKPEPGKPEKWFVKFSLAADRKKGTHRNHDETVWYTVILTGKNVEADPDAVVALYSSGKRVLAHGRLDVNAFVSPKNPSEILVERTLYPLSRPTLL